MLCGVSRRAWHKYLSSALAPPRSTIPPTIKHLLAFPPSVDTLVQTQGHVKAVRSFKNLHFVDLSDGSTHSSLNVVLNGEPGINFRVGQSVSFVGKWVESKGSQDYELLYDSTQKEHRAAVIGEVPELYPIQKKSLSYQFLRTLPTLRHRTSSLASVLRLRSFLEGLFQRFFEQNDVIKVLAPLITSADCEGAGEQFVVEAKDAKPEAPFFGKPAYLTVSTQLHLEVLSQSLNRVWALTPCFRAEDSHTNRHLSEFWMLEAELSYIESVHQICDFTENMIRYVTEDVVQHLASDLAQSRYNKEERQAMEANWQTILAAEPWPRITYTEAIEIINQVKNKGRLKGRLSWGDSIQTEHEKWLAETHFKLPVFITDYPKDQKPFYMPESNGHQNPTVACFDLIIPGIGELIGGSVREHNYDKLLQELKNRNMSIEDNEWYLSTRENGTVPHGGFGMGMERLVAFLSGMASIKDVIAFPRTPGSCSC
jgi:asparaginyl-tRNA synthetase